MGTGNLKRTITGRPALLALAALLSVLILGCGGSGSSGSTSTASAKSGGKADSGGQTSEFSVTAQNRIIVEYGEEADASDREAASAVVERNLRARAAADWAAQCASLSPFALKQVEKASPGGDCDKGLKAAGEPLSRSRSTRVDRLKGPISALRVKGDGGYALFHGNDGKDYAIAMEKDANGLWKVSALVTIEIGKTESAARPAG